MGSSTISMSYKSKWEIRGQMYQAAVKKGYVQREIAQADPSYGRVWKWQEVERNWSECVFGISMLAIIVLGGIVTYQIYYHQLSSTTGAAILLLAMAAEMAVMPFVGLAYYKVSEIASVKLRALEQMPLTKEEAEPVLEKLKQIRSGNKV